MIRYTLSCAEGHDFDGWFRSADDFDRMRAEGQVACAVCGGTGVDKAMMAPSVAAREDAPLRSAPADMTPLEKLVNRMLATNPADRPSMAEVLADDVFKVLENVHNADPDPVQVEAQRLFGAVFNPSATQ